MSDETETPKVPITATCQCGKYSITAPYVPKDINDCQCTICRRYGAAWAYYSQDEVTVDLKDGAKFDIYKYAEGRSEYRRCADCGCVLCWWSIDGQNALGLNTKMMDPRKLRYVNRRLSFGMLKKKLPDGITANPESLDLE